jgi:hypothetical protein
MPERYQSSANTSFRYWIRGISVKALDSGNRAAVVVLETPEGHAEASTCVMLLVRWATSAR